jgi:glycosyltransferase involved in cell wall biosynthesis
MRYLIKEPRVSVAIINWNYERYVADAIKSVKEQTYKNFRCVVLDNGSDDRSVDVIAEAIDGHSQFEFYQLPQNHGHLGGALWLLKHLSDEFVTFLDADDILSPDYLATHLQVHLSALSAAGFTSSNCVDVDSSGILLTGGNWWMRESWKTGEPSLEQVDRAVRLTAVDSEAYLRLAEATRYLHAGMTHWRWCPGSSNMFRRKLLERVKPSLEKPVAFGGVDGFFLPILHAISGSHLIDLPLSAYRLHGANDSSELPSLRGVRPHRDVAKAQSFSTFLLVMTSLVENIDSLLLTFSADRFWQILDVAASTERNPKIFAHPRLKSAFIHKYSRLRELFGASSLIYELRRRMPLKDCMEIIWAAHFRQSPKTKFRHS